MSKELKVLDYFIALGQTCLMQSKNYKNNEVIMLENGEQYRTQEVANIVAYYLDSYENQKHNIEMLMEENKTLKKCFKALEIIKNKFYFDWLICSKNVEQYNEAQDNDKNKLTQEEYNLLKEVLLNGR